MSKLWVFFRSVISVQDVKKFTRKLGLFMGEKLREKKHLFCIKKQKKNLANRDESSFLKEDESESRWWL